MNSVEHCEHGLIWVLSFTEELSSGVPSQQQAQIETCDCLQLDPLLRVVGV